MSVEQAAEAYIEAHQAGWKNAKHRQQWETTLRAYVYSKIGVRPIKTVDVGMVMKVLDPIWRTKPETASRVRGRIEAILGWAAVRGYRSGDNPARWKGHLENPLPKKGNVRRIEHHAALPYTEIADFMSVLRERAIISARALEFLILTAARSGEVLDAHWSEIDLEARLWTVPAARMKARHEHRVPLSEAAVSILSALPRTDDQDVIFSARGGRPLGDTTLLALLKRMGHGGLTVHGFRSAFSDWCAEKTRFPSEARELALAHAVGNRVEAAYRRGDMFEVRRQLMEAWAQYCAAPVIDNVVSISDAR